MSRIEIPDTIHQLMAIFYRLGVWNDTDLNYTFGKLCRKHIYFLYFVSGISSVALGSYTTDDEDERVFLAVVSALAVVQAYRFWIVIYGKTWFLVSVNQIGTHSTNDREDQILINYQLNALMKLTRSLLIALAIVIIASGIVFPLANERQLIFNIAFPFDRNNSGIAFWMSYVYLFVWFIAITISTCLATMIWFLMLGISFEYKILGNQLRHLGMNRQTVSLVAPQQKHFVKDLIVAIETYDKINGALEYFVFNFGNLFLLQIETGSICICGALYALAFSTHENMLQDGVYIAFLTYIIADIFMIMYLGNEITLTSDALSQCLYESDWIEQTESCKKSFIIFTERLKRPQVLVVGKLFNLDLQTFNLIVNGAYRMFNILQSFR